MVHVTIQSFSDVFPLFAPRPLAKMAEACDVPYDRVAKWKQRNYIPPEYWADLAKGAHYLGKRLSYDDLVRCAERRGSA